MKKSLKVNIDKQLRRHLALLRAQYNDMDDPRKRQDIRIQIEDIGYERCQNKLRLPFLDFEDQFGIILSTGQENIANGWGDHVERLVTIRVPRTATIADVHDFIRVAFSRSCNHTFDCCGCYQHVGEFYRKVSKREYIALVFSYRNV